MRRLDANGGAPKELFLKAAITGVGGTGKTSFGVTAPKPVIILTELQGMLHVEQAAHRLQIPTPPVLYAETAEDLRRIHKALRSPVYRGGVDHATAAAVTTPEELAQVKRLVIEEIGIDMEYPETVVLDSLTDACGLLISEIREVSPQKIGRDGLPADAQRFWGVLIDRCVGVIKSFRDLPMHTLFLCQLDDRTSGEGEEAMRIVQPRLPTKQLAAELCHAVNVLGYTYRTQKDPKKASQVVYGIATSGPEYMMTKQLPPLRPVEVPNFSSWVDRVRGLLTEAPDAPSAPENMRDIVKTEDKGAETNG